MHQFQSFVYSRSPDIIAVTETWLSDNILDNEILPNSYSIVRKDRQSRGGGVMLAIKNSKSYEVMPSPPNLELIIIRIASSIPVIYCLVYIPPKSSDEYLQDFFNFLTNYKNITDNLILFGDFNFNDINWNSLYGNTSSSAKFCETVFELNLTQLIDEATHIHGNILDLVLTNNIDIIHDITVNSKQPLPISSDHFIITFKLHSNMACSFDKLVTKMPNFANGDFVGLCHYLSNADFTPCFQSNDIEFVWSFISTLIKSGFSHFIPTTVINHQRQPKWFNSDIRHHIKCLHTLKRKYNKHPTDSNKVKIEESENLLQAKISHAKSNYEANLVSTYANNNNSKIYSYIKNIAKSTSLPSTLFHDSIPANSDSAKANAFNNYFHSVFNQDLEYHSYIDHSASTSSLSKINISDLDVYNVLVGLDTTKAMGPDGIPPIVLSTCASALYKPLHYLFSMCLNSGYLPFEWKLHKVTPIYKSGDRCQIKNYRPISLLCNTSKVLERLIYNKIIDHVISYVKPVQFGFMPCRSTVQQLLLFMHDIFNSCQTDAIYLDISKAFDTVSHVHLLDKLTSIDIVGDLWLWFRAYLMNRFQYVSVNNYYSQLLPVESGVPQGSILGPLLFVVYVNDLPDTVLHSKILLFADDTKCFRQTSHKPINKYYKQI